MGLAGHYWYAFLDKRFAGHGLMSIRKKLLCEMAVGPPFGASLFFVSGALEGKPIVKTIDELKKNFHYLIAADWLFYIPLQYFNFLYLPPKYRFLYVAILSLFYDTALVYLLHKEDFEESKKLEQK